MCNFLNKIQHFFFLVPSHMVCNCYVSCMKASVIKIFQWMWKYTSGENFWSSFVPFAWKNFLLIIYDGCFLCKVHGNSHGYRERYLTDSHCMHTQNTLYCVWSSQEWARDTKNILKMPAKKKSLATCHRAINRRHFLQGVCCCLHV